MTITHTLHQETEAARTLLANLADVIGDDDDMKRDIVEGETDLLEAIDQAVWMLAADMAHIKGLNDYIDKFTARKERLQQRVEHMRAALAVAMEQAGRKKIEHQAVTLSLRPTAPSVQVIDEASIPSKFWKPSEPKLDKVAVKEALKAKENVPGATMSNGGISLTLSWS
jgi:hypothetical protein